MQPLIPDIVSDSGRAEKLVFMVFDVKSGVLLLFEPWNIFDTYPCDRDSQPKFLVDNPPPVTRECRIKCNSTVF